MKPIWHKALGSVLVVVGLVSLGLAGERPDLSRILMHSTVRIEVTKPEGRHTGTGFYYVIPSPAQTSSIPLIVTCAHLINGATAGEFFLAITGSNRQDRVEIVRRVSFADCGSQWIHHPDPKIDLAAIPVAPLMRILEKQGKGIDMSPFNPQLFPSQEKLDDLSLFQEVKVVGYPIGIWDSQNNLPILRRGMVASDLGKDFNGAPEFLIDAAILPGSSGSPVIVADDGAFVDSGTLMSGMRVIFLGVVYATPMQATPGKVQIIPIPTAFDAVAITPTPSSLGVVLKARLLDDFGKVFGVKSESDANKALQDTAGARH